MDMAFERRRADRLLEISSELRNIRMELDSLQCPSVSSAVNDIRTKIDRALDAIKARTGYDVLGHITE